MPKPLFDLTGRVALVTGGAGHLGAAFSEALAQHGATVIVSSPNLDKCEKFAKNLGSGHDAVQLDLADEASVRRAVDEVIGRHGSLDILVNNGYASTTPGHDEAAAEDFQKAFAVGLTGYYVASRCALAHMRKQKRGSIINIASMYGLVGSYPDVYENLDFKINSPPNYHAAKGGLIHLTRYLAVYWARYGVRVNAISPGPFPPSRVSQARGGETFLRRLSERVPLKRVGKPEELQGALLLLASDAGSYITGQNIVVDGGWTAW